MNGMPCCLAFFVYVYRWIYVYEERAGVSWYVPCIRACVRRSTGGWKHDVRGTNQGLRRDRLDGAGRDAQQRVLYGWGRDVRPLIYVRDAWCHTLQLQLALGDCV